MPVDQSRRSALVDSAHAVFRGEFGDRTDVAVALAPGRVNLIGEHTDYNGGFVLPMAIDRYVAIAFARSEGRRVRAHAVRFGETDSIELPVPKPVGAGHWSDYVAGVVAMYARAGDPPPGLDLAIVADLPVGAGLSSSAAVELATARALTAATDRAWDPIEAAQRSRDAEHDFAGVPCGIMDQLVVAAAREGTAMLVDCRTLDRRYVPIPAELRVVVLDTGVGRSLAAGGYADRRGACEAAVQILRRHDPGVVALRDVDGALLDRARHDLDDEEFMRSQHVVAESPRAVDCARALETGDVERCRRLLVDSHWSLRDLYQVSCPELDLMVSLACAHEGCIGARLTGAGFGGSAVALVRLDAVDDFVARIGSAYDGMTGRRAALHVCRPVDGVAIV